MKKTIIVACLAVLTMGTSLAQEFKPDESYYGVGFWSPDTLGNHRAVVMVEQQTDVVKAIIPWRRRDLNPQDKGIIIIDSKTGKVVNNFVRKSITQEVGELVFQAASAPAEYYIYYLPYQTSGGPYPKIKYSQESSHPDVEWLQKANSATNIPQATFKQFQAISSIDTFYPMEIVATEKEQAAVTAANSGKPFIIFPEDREHAIRMFNTIPYRWAARGADDKFCAEADMNEYFVFQLGLWAFKSDIKDVKVTFSDLKGTESTIPASALTCFNTEGKDWMSRQMALNVDVAQGKVQPLWIGVDIPAKGVTPGVYKGSVTVQASGMTAQSVAIEINLSDRMLPDRGDGDVNRLSRLRWLNSDFAFDNKLVKPYTPVRVDGNKISILGRDVTLDAFGLPASINSYFKQEMTGIGDNAKAIISSPMKFVIQQGSKTLPMQNNSMKFISTEDGIATWKSENRAGNFDVKIDALMEADGFMQYNITVKALEKATIDDIRLEVPIAEQSAKYWLGLGSEGSFRPTKGEWKWDVAKNQEGYWFGDVNSGIQCLFRDENYVRPLNTNFYHQKPLHMPTSWYNDGKGGISFVTKKGTLDVKTYSGKRTIDKGEELHFNLLVSVTPFKAIDTKKQWSDRYIHSYLPVEEAMKDGANTINIHHANPINPFINYPFLRPDFMKQYVDGAHAAGAKVKIYYTVRELSNSAPELWALRSLGNEIFSDGDIGGYSWLREHLGENYIAAWFVDQYRDAAIVNSGVSRWHNYYVEGLEWLVKNIGIDGIYIDDLAIDRTTMKRVRKVLEHHRPEPRIDLHSANQFNAKDGFINSAFLYMEHMPYLDRLWFGEYFKYEKNPDYWMTEVSGIPFGMMGEMLQDDGNPYRGMLYGMTSRYRYGGSDRPKYYWRVWDNFGIMDSRMIGYWVADNPVKTDNDAVKATSFVRDGKVMIAIASWATSDVDVKLNIDWERLGIDKSKARLHFPAMGDIQSERVAPADGVIRVEKDKGFLMILQ